MDRMKVGRIRLDEIKSISATLNDASEDMEEPTEVDTKQELSDLYESVKDRLEKKNVTLENIVYEQLKYLPN
jgi:hypothetical protein